MGKSSVHFDPAEGDAHLKAFGAAFEAECEKAGSQRIDPLGQFLPGPPDAVARRNQRLAVGPTPGRGIEAASDGVAEQRRIGDAANVAIRFFCQVCSLMPQGMCWVHCTQGLGQEQFPGAVR